jgi:hypothetical protein
MQIDFAKDNILPKLNRKDLDYIGVKADKAVLLKENIIKRNKGAHADIPDEEYAALIGGALYNSDEIN